jgi:hypothetical protein
MHLLCEIVLGLAVSVLVVAAGVSFGYVIGHCWTCLFGSDD